jgi:hypothetical protein
MADGAEAPVPKGEALNIVVKDATGNEIQVGRGCVGIMRVAWAVRL